MALDFSDSFKKYEALVAEVDKVFDQVRSETGESVRCDKGCSDCCHALFDLSLVEAIYLNHHFNRTHEGMVRSRIIDQADAADRQAQKLKRDVFRKSREGVNTAELLDMVAKQRVRCSLLGEDDLCELYEHRPVTCRLYGIPMAVNGESRTCGLSGFEPGGSYPTVHLERIQDRLMAISRELVAGLNTRYDKLWDVLMPVSMALLTDFDENYLGVGTIPTPKPGFAAEEGESAKLCSECDQDASSCADFSQDGSCSCSDCGGGYSVTLGGEKTDEE